MQTDLRNPGLRWRYLRHHHLWMAKRYAAASQWYDSSSNWSHCPLVSFWHCTVTSANNHNQLINKWIPSWYNNSNTTKFITPKLITMTQIKIKTTKLFYAVSYKTSDGKCILMHNRIHSHTTCYSASHPDHAKNQQWQQKSQTSPCIANKTDIHLRQFNWRLVRKDLKVIK